MSYHPCDVSGNKNLSLCLKGKYYYYYRITGRQIASSCRRRIGNFLILSTNPIYILVSMRVLTRSTYWSQWEYWPYLHTGLKESTDQICTLYILESFAANTDPIDRHWSLVPDTHCTRDLWSSIWPSYQREGFRRHLSPCTPHRPARCQWLTEVTQVTHEQHGYRSWTCWLYTCCHRARGGALCMHECALACDYVCP